jgi:putative ABC transport system permease protein
MQDYIEGDLMEVYEARKVKSGRLKADVRFIIDVLLLFRPGIIRPAEGYKNLNTYGMYKSYFKIGWRNIVRQKLYSTINVLGLTLGICACIIIFTITNYELSFDSFHTDKDRIYRVMGDLTESTGSILHFSRLPIPMLHQARTEVSGLDFISGVIPLNAQVKITNGKEETEFESLIQGTRIVTTIIADPQYFQIFEFEWIAGDIKKALSEPYKVVLTESRARQYFGSIPIDEMMGRQIIYEDSLLTNVTGIVKDWSANTDLPFTDFISFKTVEGKILKQRINTESWSQRVMACSIFAKLSTGITPRDVDTQLEEIAKPHTDEIRLKPWLEPISNIHFNNDVIENPMRTAHLPTIYSLIGVAVFILLLAMINFVNLSTAQALQRAKEVGVRRILGSSRASLSFQFLIETLILTSIAALFAIILVDPIINQFKTFVPEGIAFQLFNSSTIIFLIIIILITTFLSGVYPAFIVSSHKPAVTLRGLSVGVGNEKWMLRKGLIVFQFSVSLVFIMGSIVVSNQLKYTMEKNLGFKSEAIILVETPWTDPIDKTVRLTDRIKLIKNVNNVAQQWVSPLMLNGRSRSIKFKSTDEKYLEVVQLAGNEEFIPVYEMKLLAGRNLVHSDSMKEFVINENLARLMGCKNPDEAIGKTLYWDDSPLPPKPFPVVGVVADFHTRSFHESIAPLCIVNRPDRERTLAIKLSSIGEQSDVIKAALKQIEKTYNEIYPETTFKYSFFDDSLAQIYESDQRTGTLINTSMIIAIFISCIGLFGLTLFTSERRAKEISIRKILGASASSIAFLLSCNFIVLVIIALVIASPIAFYFINQWLQGFAYHINFNWMIIFIAGAAALFLALITVSFQTIKAALVNPVRNLRSE